MVVHLDEGPWRLSLTMVKIGGESRHVGVWEAKGGLWDLRSKESDGMKVGLDVEDTHHNQ